jgi:hypothetical protein
MAFSLTLFDRSDRAYSWMGTVFLAEAALAAFFIFSVSTQHVSFQFAALFGDFFLPLINAGWVMVWWVWFRMQRPAWLPRVVVGLIVISVFAAPIGEELFFNVFPHSVAVAFLTVVLILPVLFFSLQLWIVILGIRGQRLEGWLVLPSVVLLGIIRFANVVQIRINWLPFGVPIGVNDIGYLLLMVTAALLLLRRLLNSVRAQRLMALDVKQAQEVQQVILPVARSTIPGLVIESEYRPSLEVGGDFFQIIPCPSDGSLLIVAGDVTGKGLKAGMLVALLVGAIRSTAELNGDPLFVLEALNRRLIGRSEAHATCLALRIAADGEIALANAGHLPPYLNGEPVVMEGALPLGMMEGAAFSVMRFKLADGGNAVTAYLLPSKGTNFRVNRYHVTVSPRISPYLPAN